MIRAVIAGRSRVHSEALAAALSQGRRVQVVATASHPQEVLALLGAIPRSGARGAGWCLIGSAVEPQNTLWGHGGLRIMGRLLVSVRGPTETVAATP